MGGFLIAGLADGKYLLKLSKNLDLHGSIDYPFQLPLRWPIQ